jgi:catechol 2,3-dioxygenase-like lactoylglutathione lyase family enzyme
MAVHQRATGIARLSHLTLAVEDVEESLTWFTEMLGFEKRADEVFEGESGQEGRWVTVAAPGDDLEIALIVPDPKLCEAAAWGALEATRGTDHWWTFSTDDCRETVATLEAKGVTVTLEPVDLPWGVQAMIADPCGNEFTLMEMTV